MQFSPIEPPPRSANNTAADCLRVEHRREFVLQLAELREVVAELAVDGLQHLPLLLLRVQRRVQLRLQLRLRLPQSVVLRLKGKGH